MSSEKSISFGLSKTGRLFASGLAGIFSAGSRFDAGVFERIEDHLIMSDLGAATSLAIVDELKRKVGKQSGISAGELLGGLGEIISSRLRKAQKNAREISADGPRVILMVGVNGVGKTTMLGKLAHHLKHKGRSVMMAACDTFRAAAIEQLQAWGDRLDVAVIARHHGADAAAVAYDALNAAKARKVDYLLIDSAGRQHTHGDLMEQLAKIKRVLGRADAQAPHDVYMNVDAGNGQNVLSQVENFNRAVPITAICVTKLDGTARGGVIISLADRFELPILYVGVGEGVADLKPFAAEDFVSALLPDVEDFAI